jgi:hypothetical protein
MSRNTTFRFIGSIVQELPDLVSKSYEMASGDVLTWVNESLKVIDSMGKVVVLIMNKKKTKFLESEINSLYEEQEELDQELKSTIDDIKRNCENDRKKIQKIYSNRKKATIQAEIEYKLEISKAMASTRQEVKKLIDIYDEKIKQIIDSEVDFKNEKRNLEECKRLLQQQYNKNIDI